MSEIDKRALDANFAIWKADRMPSEVDGLAFECYVIDEVLQDHVLSDDDIESGRTGGGDDGGVDGMYFIVDGMLVREDGQLPQGKAQEADLILIQVKRSGGFSETVFERITNFTRDLFEWETPVDRLMHLSDVTRANISLFRSAYDKILGDLPQLRVSVYYVTGSAATDNPKITAKSAALATYVKSKISHAEVKAHFWDCVTLLAAVHKTPQEIFRVPTVEMFATNDGAAIVCLVRVVDMASLLGDDTGGQRKSLLQSNVRAHQGNVQVNKDIRQTLERGDEGRDFWWFNNGVTILADACHFAGNHLVMTRPQIVNGLQTCHELFEYVAGGYPPDDSRSVLLRVIRPPDPETRNNIIKATNFQTAITSLSLKAMDRLHFNIEDRLQLYDLYYERRKGEYRALRKPRAQIVSMLELSKAVIAIVLRRPDTARARPGTMLNRDERYEEVFPEQSDTEVYATCIRIDRRVEKHLARQPEIERTVRADLRYYVDLLVTCMLVERPGPSRAEIAALKDRVAEELTGPVISAAFAEVRELYGELGGTDKVSKGPDLRVRLEEYIDGRWTVEK